MTTKDNNYFHFQQIKNNWIGNLPATEKKLKKLNQDLELNYEPIIKNFLKIANGYPTYNDAVELSSFEKINQIEYLKNFDPDMIKIWSQKQTEDIEKN